MHKHTEIRQAVIDLLESTDVSFNLYDSRYSKIPADKLPAVNVFIGDEAAEQTVDKENNIRFPLVILELSEKGKDSVEDQETGEESLAVKFDNLLEQVQSELNKFRQTIDGLVHWIDYKEMKKQPVEQDSDDYILSAMVIYEVRYDEELPALT